MNPRENSLEHALENAVSRALRDNLAPLQRTANELQQAYADLVAACASTRPSNALPAMLRAQTAAAALAAGLSVLSNFVAVALNPRESEGTASAAATAVAAEEPPGPVPAEVAEPAGPGEPEDWNAPESAGESTDVAQTVPSAAPLEASSDGPASEGISATLEVEQSPTPVPTDVSVQSAAETETSLAEASTFDLATLPPEMQDLHRRANRVAKVAMQDIKLLRPKDVQAGREHKDLCERLRVDLDKARKEYDRRFRAISDHPVDYFHHWMLEILAGGDSSALGEYPYPSTALKH